MLLQCLGAVALAVNAVNAVRGSAPFFVLSTEPLSTNALDYAQVATSKDVQDRLLESLRGCTSQTYIIVSQPGISASDLTPRLMPYMHSSTQSEAYKRNITIAEVLGEVDAGSLSQRIAAACNGVQYTLQVSERIRSDVSLPQIVTVTLPAVSDKQTERKAQLIQHDQYLHTVLSEIPQSTPYTFIYTASAPAAAHYLLPNHSDGTYEMDEPYPSAPHTDLKRDLNAYPRQSNSSSNRTSTLPLFETYQFTSPGIFMGFAVSLLLFSILWVGVSAIAGLEVSYMAFNKEMGPAAQKKQLQ